MPQAELAVHRETDRRRQDQMVETLRVIRVMRLEMRDIQAELLALLGQQRRARHSGPKARIPDHQDASGDADSHIYCRMLYIMPNLKSFKSEFAEEVSVSLILELS
ncbi:hypothetical protein Tco_1310294 [Tanacetum coccineum]